MSILPKKDSAIDKEENTFELPPKSEENDEEKQHKSPQVVKHIVKGNK